MAFRNFHFSTQGRESSQAMIFHSDLRAIVQKISSLSQNGKKYIPLSKITKKVTPRDKQLLFAAEELGYVSEKDGHYVSLGRAITDFQNHFSWGSPGIEEKIAIKKREFYRSVGARSNYSP